MRKASQIRMLLALCIGVCGTLSGANCRRQVTEECYAELEYMGLDPEIAAVDLPYCSYTFSTVPNPPEGNGFTHRVGYGFVPSADTPCDPCDIDRLDSLLRSTIEARMSQGSPSCARMEPSEPVGLCVHQPNENSEECRVLGIFYSNFHDVPIEYGCSDCRENDSCDHAP